MKAVAYRVYPKKGGTKEEVIGVSPLATRNDYDIEPAGAYGLIHNYSDSSKSLYLCLEDTWSPACSKATTSGIPHDVPPGKTYSVAVELFQYDYFCIGKRFYFEKGSHWVPCSGYRDRWHFHWSSSPIEETILGENGTLDDWSEGEICALTYIDGQFIVWNMSGEQIAYTIAAHGKINGTEVTWTTSHMTTKSAYIGLLYVFGASKYGIDYLWSIDGQLFLYNSDYTIKKHLYVKGGILACKNIVFESEPTGADVKVE